jgi:hypothetical protein
MAASMACCSRPKADLPAPRALDLRRVIEKKATEPAAKAS